jgi:predicted nucleic acid-binding protein
MSGDEPQALRVVLDTNVAVSGLLSHWGAAHALMDLAVPHQARLRLSASADNHADFRVRAAFPAWSVGINSQW